jgi:hypothetical protein
MKNKHQIPISKSQMNHNYQIRISKQNGFGHLVIGYWELFEIWDL